MSTPFWTLGILDTSKKADFWEELAKRKNAGFKIITTVSRDLNRLELTFDYKDVKVKFTESDTKPLFIECNFQRDIGHIWFEISRSDFIARLMSLFSKHKIKSANKKFNLKYLIRGNSSLKVRKIINNEKITSIILRENITFIGGKQAKNGTFILTLNIHRNINSIEQLETVYNLTIRLIDIIMGE